LRQTQHIPKYIDRSRPKSGIMIICGHYCQFDPFILYGFKIVDPLLNTKYTINLNPYMV
jgi:hypothetical protein